MKTMNARAPWPKRFACDSNRLTHEQEMERLQREDGYLNPHCSRSLKTSALENTVWKFKIGQTFYNFFSSFGTHKWKCVSFDPAIHYGFFHLLPSDVNVK